MFGFPGPLESHGYPPPDRACSPSEHMAHENGLRFLAFPFPEKPGLRGT